MKKKVLLALIALVSFATSWAVDETPSVNVSVKGAAEADNTTVVLKGAGLFEQGGIATLLNEGSGVAAPEAWPEGGTAKYPTQAIVNANFETVTGNLTAEGHYYVKVTSEGKTLYVPFQVGVRDGITRENIWNKETWDASVASGILKGYFTLFPYFDLYDATAQQGFNYTEEEWNALSDDQKAQWANAHDWRAITNSTVNRDKMFPQVNYKVTAEGNHKVLVEYNTPTTENGVTTPHWASIIPQLDGTEEAVNPKGGFWMVSIPQLYTSNAYPHDSGQDVVNNLNEDYLPHYDADGNGNVLNAAQVADPNITDPATATTIMEALTANFDWNMVKLALLPGDAQYAGLYDYAWTMSPISANYNGQDQTPTIKVSGNYANGDAATLTEYSDNPTSGGNKEYESYKVEYFTDAACKNQVEEMVDAGTYYVKVSIYAGTEMVDNEEEAQWIDLGAKRFVIGATQLTLTLMKLEKNYLDPDPVFEDFGVAGWLYANPNNQYVPFYTLTDKDGNAITTDQARLKGMIFERVDEGEAVYTSEGKAQYRYTIPLSKIHVVTPPASAKDDQTGAWPEEAWEAIDLADKSTYEENYTIVNGSMERLQIVPRNLANLDLVAENVIYNGAEFNAINAMDDEDAEAADDKVNVTGLFFTTSDGEKIPVDLTQVTVAVTEGEFDNTNVTREGDDIEGDVLKNSSLTLTASSKSNFEGSTTVKFQIDPRDISDVVEALDENGEPVLNDEGEKTYNPGPFANDFEVTIARAEYAEEESVEPEFTFVDKGRKDATPVTLNTGKADLEVNPVADDYTYEFANNTSVAYDEDGNVDDAATLTLTGVGNYTGTRVVNFAVQPIDITNWDVELAYEDFTEAEIENEGYIYNGKEKQPIPTVSKTVTTGDNAVSTTSTLTPDDYTVSYENNIHAGELSAVVIITGKGNYTGVNRKTFFSIDQKELVVAPDAGQQKSYGEDDPEELTYTITGWEDNDQYVKTTTDKGEVVRDQNGTAIPKPDATDGHFTDSPLKQWLDSQISISRAEGEDNGEYLITVTGPANTAGYTGDNYNDYKITYADDVVYTVGRLGLTITPDLLVRAFGESLAPAEGESYTYTITGWQADDDAEALEAELREILEVTIAPAATSYPVGLHREQLTISGNQTQFGNYLITYRPGDIRITAPTVALNPIIRPVDVDNNNTPYNNLTIETVVYGQKYAIAIDPEGVPADLNLTGIEFKAYKANGDELVEIAEREHVGTYAIKPTPETVAKLKTTDNKIGNYIVTLGEGELEITPRPVFVIAEDQLNIAYNGAIDQSKWYTLPNMDEGTLQNSITSYSYTENPKAADATHDKPWFEIVETEEAGLLEGDKLGNNSKYAENSGILLIKDKNATKVDELYEDAISIYIEDENPDYHITKYYGDLKNEPGDNPVIVLQRPTLTDAATWTAQKEKGKTLWFREAQKDEDGNDVIDENNKVVYNYVVPTNDDYVSQGRGLNPEDMQPNTAAQLIADYDGQEVTVKFGHYAIEGNKWETLVLPFDIRVKDLSAALGYALVDVLDEDNSSATNMAFVKEIYTLEANTPFLVKVPYNIDLANVEFGNVTIVNPESETDLTAGKAGDNQFIGTYTGKYEPQNGGTTYFRNGERQDGSSTLNVYALGAYIKFAPNAANVRITIEEEDGTITAIDAVGAEIAAQGAAEGWYTISGVKLNAKPAQKGVYIFNGKKVSIK